MKRIIILSTLAMLAACNRPTIQHLDYRAIAFSQNELILSQEEKIEELTTVIQATLPAYRPDYSTIDSLNYILDSIYTHPSIISQHSILN